MTTPLADVQPLIDWSLQHPHHPLFKNAVAANLYVRPDPSDIYQFAYYSGYLTSRGSSFVGILNAYPNTVSYQQTPAYPYPQTTIAISLTNPIALTLLSLDPKSPSGPAVSFQTNNISPDTSAAPQQLTLTFTDGNISYLMNMLEVSLPNDESVIESVRTKMKKAAAKV